MVKLFGLDNLLGGSAPHQLGIDLGARSIKVVGIRNNKSTSPKVVCAAREETPMGIILDGKLNDARTLIDILKMTLERAKIPYKGKQASVGLRGVNVIYKRLLLPFQEPHEMGQQILLEAQQHVLSDLDDWLLDWQIMTRPDTQGQVAVMLVAAKKDMVLEYENLFREVGLVPSIFDCDVFAVENSLEHSESISEETVLCLDIGADSSKMNLLQDGMPIIVRSFSPGGSHLTEAISKTLGIDLDEAEVLKVTPDSPSKPIQEIIDAHIGELCEEIKRTLDFFASSGSDVQVEAIDRVVLSGGGSHAKGLAEGIKKFLNTQVSYSNPFTKMTVLGEASEIIGANPSLFTVATGLALRYVGDKPS